MTVRRIILESPYACSDKSLGHHARAMVVAENVSYARACVRDSLLRNEAPLASHLLYTQAGVLDDGLDEERQRGIDAGLAWGPCAEASVFYLDRGFSRGMGYGLSRAYHERRQIEFRAFGPVHVKLVVNTNGAWWREPAPGEVRPLMWLRNLYSEKDLAKLADDVTDNLARNHGVLIDVNR